MEYLLTLLALVGLPLHATAKGNGPDISTVSYPSNVRANVAATLSATVTSSVGTQSCHLYVDSEDIGEMSLNSSSASRSYTFPRGGVFTVFVFCRDQNGGMSSGPNTSILVGGEIIQQDAYSGSGPDSTPSPEPASPPIQQTPEQIEAPTPVFPAGSLIKLTCPEIAEADHPCKTVYYYGKDMKRHAFPNSRAFFTWYDSFDNVASVDEMIISQIPLGKNITYRPGKRMVKFQTVDKVYAVSKGGVLRWVPTEAIAKNLYGEEWNKQIDDISDAFYTNYTFGDDISETNLYSPDEQVGLVPTIDAN